jgi:hypothetical protein
MSAVTVSRAAPIARLVGVPLVSGAVIIFLCAPASPAPTADTGRVGLVEKDARWNVVAADKGGASGGVWYSARSPTLHVELRARGLKPSVRYMIEMNVDGKTYEVSSHAADPQGLLAVDTTLTNFANGVCDKGAYIAPEPLHGAHQIKFLVKRDGHPVGGSLRQVGSGGAVAPALPCQGNGDEDFSYALFEDNVAHYTGTR